MSAEIAMLLSAAIGVGASLLTLLITRAFDARSEKRKERERFFYEMYGRRLALYRKILKQIYLFSDATSSDPLDAPKRFGKITATFIELSSRGSLVASLAVADSLKNIDHFINEWMIRGRGRERTREELNTLISFLAEQSALLRDRIREETCPALVDEYLFELTGTGFKHRKPPADNPAVKS